ncbi:SAM hydrolase/SAM-dependent halogenase family protein [Halodesulfovibrio spirochaetisodalis]|uniref:SAM hydrolase/SAM-dependent halogenase family protein n=1 Tax=Halodesulfovibrio spirochaetisodalis TaxID=1560234 RepID=UPI000830B095|nr:SAM-dependent chlorinase/fluorinase [Halodesulfovibrio spirochaetisodalis]
MSLNFFLLTDFGNIDPYVAQMKGVLSTLAPQHPIFDITHNIAPHHIAQAAFFLDATVEHLPPYSITICVVDPGVGTSRDILCMNCNDRIVLAPDNGCLSFLSARYPDAPVYRIKQENLPLEHTSHSCTFHGRTMFSPLAADLALHIEQRPSYIECTSPLPFSENSTQDCRLELFPPQPEHALDILDTYMQNFGHKRAENIVTLTSSVPKVHDKMLETQVLHIDTFGNVILNLPSAAWRKRFAAGGKLQLYTQTTRPLKLISAYAELAPNQVGIICGSQGYLELACNMCSAAQFISLKLDDTINILFSNPPEV